MANKITTHAKRELSLHNLELGTMFRYRNSSDEQLYMKIGVKNATTIVSLKTGELYNNNSDSVTIEIVRSATIESC
jgi:hypothetical protein